MVAKQMVLKGVIAGRVEAAAVVEPAQIGFVHVDSWGLVGYLWTMSGSSAFVGMPTVSCPVVDVSRVKEADFVRVSRAHGGGRPEGYDDIPGLVRALVAVGGKVLQEGRR